MSTLLYHARVRVDVREILAYYDERSDTAGDRFFEEFEKAIARISDHPERFGPDGDGLRRCSLVRFPYHILFDQSGSDLRIWVIRHHKRHPSFGKKRRWR